MIKFKDFVESMVAGDSGGSPDKMASGETTGAATNIGATTLGSVSKKKQTESCGDYKDKSKEKVDKK